MPEPIQLMGTAKSSLLDVSPPSVYCRLTFSSEKVSPSEAEASDEINDVVPEAALESRRQEDFSVEPSIF
jgi:hypothetical protein